MTEYAATTTAVRLKFHAVDDFGADLTGVTDLYARVWYIDNSENLLFFDWNDNTFKAFASCVTPNGTLAQIDATALPGWYTRTLPAQAAAGTYTVSYGQVGNTVANLVGADEEIIVGRLAVPGDPMDLVTDAVDATSVAASAVTELQAGLATAAALAALPAAVWAVPEGTGTYGASLALIRKFQTNPMWADTTGGGRYRLWDDDLETVILTIPLRDGDGNAITTPAGSPARRGTPVL